MRDAGRGSVGVSSGLSVLAERCAGFFDDLSWVEKCQALEAAALPEAARTLLAHADHMTRTLRRFFGAALRLQVLEEQANAERYARKILLRCEPDRRVVEFGIMRVDLRRVPQEARREILERVTPLGDVLLRHGVLTRVEPEWFVRFPRGTPIVQYLEREGLAEAYGRLATIHWDGEAAVELLEVVAG